MERCQSLDVNRLVREGAFDLPGCSSGWIGWNDPATGEEHRQLEYELDTDERRLRIRYRLSFEEAPLNYTLELTTTRLPWGGVRWWFRCPLIHGTRYCGRRVAKLHRPPRCPYYGCRCCYGLTYRSCQQSRKPSSLWARMAPDIGESPAYITQMMADEDRMERRAERMARRTERMAQHREQRRRRRQRRAVLRSAQSEGG